MTVAPAPARPASVVASSPYPWPFHGRVDPSRMALVACLDERWRRDGPAADAADGRLGEVARRLASLGGLVVAVVPAGRGGAPSTFPLDVTVEAAGTSGFYGSRLDAVLREVGRTDLVVCGWGLEGPVHSTLRAANDRGYECLLVPDACTAVDEGLVDGACSTVCMSGGIFGAVAGTERLFEALGPVGAPSETEHVDDERTFG